MAAGRTLCLVLLAACAARPAEPLEHPAVVPVEQAPRGYLHVVAAPRPDVDLSALLPDPTEEARWPLAMDSHPVLEPRFDIAGALAVPGVTWLDLCARGAQNRKNAAQRELYEYLAGWCEAANRHADAALGHFAQLQQSVVLGLAAAVRIDLVNVLADAGDAGNATKLLAHHNLISAEGLDLLAATYFEIGDYASALQVTREAVAADPTPADVTRCHRATRLIVLADPAQRVLLLDELDRFITARARGKQPVDPACVASDQELQCWAAPATHCGLYFESRSAPSWQTGFVAAVAAWPREPASWSSWWRIVEATRQAIPADGADRLAVAAMEASLRVSECTDPRLDAIRAVAGMIGDEPRHAHELDARLAKLLQVTPDDCRALARVQ